MRWLKQLMCGVLEHCWEPDGMFSATCLIPARKCHYCGRRVPSIRAGRVVSWGE